MRKLFLITSAAMMAIAAPAVGAPPQGKGKGPAVKAAKAPAKARAGQTVRGRKAVRQARASGPNYGVNACPRGLVAKNNGCLPPGQAKRLFAQGQRVPTGYGYYTPAGSIPEQYFSQIPQSYRSGDYRYVYRDDSIYVVNPETRVVETIVSLLR